jgi:hypothetical protein
MNYIDLGKSGVHEKPGKNEDKNAIFFHRNIIISKKLNPGFLFKNSPQIPTLKNSPPAPLSINSPPNPLS